MCGTSTTVSWVLLEHAACITYFNSTAAFLFFSLHLSSVIDHFTTGVHWQESAYSISELVFKTALFCWNWHCSIELNSLLWMDTLCIWRIINVGLIRNCWFLLFKHVFTWRKLLTSWKSLHLNFKDYQFWIDKKLLIWLIFFFLFFVF